MTEQEAFEAKSERIVALTVIEILALAVGVGAAINFFFYALPRGNKAQIIVACAAIIIFATIGVAAHLLAGLPSDAITPRDDHTRMLEKVVTQNDAALRPYLGVSYVKATMIIAKPISILIKFTNNGKTPAESVEILQRYQKVPTGTLINRNYAGKEFDSRSVGLVNVGNTIETEIVGHVWTLDELMELTTTEESMLFAHGVVRYRSKYIPGGSDETPFCYEFDKTSGQMVICRVRDHSTEPTR